MGVILRQYSQTSLIRPHWSLGNFGRITQATKNIHMTFDSVFGKRVLTYWENRGTPGCDQMDGFMIAIENYIFLERGKPHLSKNV